MTRGLWCFCLAMSYWLDVWPLFAQTPDARTELTLGIAAYEKGVYEEAIQHLEHVVSLNPRAVNGHFYLAMVYDEMFLPAVEPGDENGHWSRLAIQEYKKVLQLEPTHENASKRLAHVFFELARYGEAENYYRKAATLDANDPEALYGIAVIDWVQTYRLLSEKRASLRLAPKQSLIGSAYCHEGRRRNLDRVDEGLKLLAKVLQLRNDVEAQAYMAVFYQERAEIQCGDPSAYKRDQSSAKQWWTRSCEALHNQTGRVIPWGWLAAPPPPPPKKGDTCTF